MRSESRAETGDCGVALVSDMGFPGKSGEARCSRGIASGLEDGYLEVQVAGSLLQGPNGFVSLGDAALVVNHYFELLQIRLLLAERFQGFGQFGQGAGRLLALD